MPAKKYTLYSASAKARYSSLNILEICTTSLIGPVNNNMRQGKPTHGLQQEWGRNDSFG
jgi:hypothetical protein